MQLHDYDTVINTSETPYCLRDSRALLAEHNIWDCKQKIEKYVLNYQLKFCT